jgi:SAM-dependent methyltransferase
MRRTSRVLIAVLAIAFVVALAAVAARAARAQSTPEGPRPSGHEPGPPGHEHGHDADRHDATVRHSFEDVEKWAEKFDDPGRAEWQKPDSVVAALPLGPGSVVLDIGAGTGYFNRAFAARVRPGGRVFAADIEPAMIAHMLERARREATPEVFPLLVPPDEPRAPMPVDLVFICDTIHHIDDRIEYLRKVRAILEPGGVVAVVDFKPGDIPVGPPPEHRIARDLVIEEMAAAGFRLDREETFLPYQYMLLFTIRN